MRLLLISLGAGLLLVVGGGAAVFGTDEVVSVHTADAGGELHQTSVWIVDEGETAWLFATKPKSAWLLRLSARPEITLERGDATHKYTAVPVPDAETRERIGLRMSEKYGFSYKILDMTLGHEQSVPIRLDPR